MSRSYSKSACPICGLPISVAGAARVSHGRSHVRKGEAIEVDNRILGRIVFMHPVRWDYVKDRYVWVEVRRSERARGYANLPERYIRIEGINNFGKVIEHAKKARRTD